MADRPILFSAPMVRAILAGTKTQTRRVVKVQPPERTYRVMPYHHPDPRQHFYAWVDSDPPRDICACSDWCQPCHYGQPGDLLWVRETYFAFGRWETRYSEKKSRDEWRFIDMTPECDRAYQYAACGPDVPLANGYNVVPGWQKRPSIHMPRAASRIMLEVVSVRVERLQDISEADALAEGTPGGHGSIPGYGYAATPVEHYRHLWESLNGNGSWEANPWVWVVEFKRAQGT